jgi:hypothetical protein
MTIIQKGELMSDLISRQAVIDALRDYLVEKRCPDDGTLTCRLIENEVINKLPPAEPKKRGMNIEQEKMIVEALPSLYPLQEFEEKAIDTVLNAIPHWIPVTENCDCDLMDNEEVLVFQKDGTINGQIRHAMFYDFNGKKKFVTWEEGITIYNVLAYMPLPEPYKGVTT